jgi:hypothetical protein
MYLKAMKLAYNVTIHAMGKAGKISTNSVQKKGRKGGLEERRAAGHGDYKPGKAYQ